MRVLLVTTGSRGDVEPFIALTRELGAAGHVPVLAAPARFHGLAAAHEVAFHGLDDSLLDLQAELAGRGTIGALTGALEARAAFERFLVDVFALADHPTDVVVYHPKTLVAPMIAEHRGVPAIAVQLIPLYQPTSAFPAPLVRARVPEWLNRATWGLVPMIEAPWRGMLRRLRREHLDATASVTGLGARIRAAGALNAWSPNLLPAPAEWPAHATPVGFLRPAADGSYPPPALLDFLGAGEPPVYVGFGSMMASNPAELGEAVLQGLRGARRRGVVATGSGAVELTGTDDVFVLDEVQHDWLMPRVAAAVHHGGVGTLAAALTAGVPQVISPFLGDQWFWARRAHELGVAVPVRALTADLLSAAITTASSDLSHRARSIGKAVAEERGIAAAVDRLVWQVEQW